jgi:hypothetical protein
LIVNPRELTIDPQPGGSFIQRYFSAENRLAEIICGLVMVLTFTATTGAAFEGTTPHALLLAVLGCNIAWGIVDAVTYVLGNLMNRGVRARLLRILKKSPNHHEASTVVNRRLEELLGDLLTDSQRAQVHDWIIENAQHQEPPTTRLKREDLYMALACFLIVFGATLPVLVPFLLIRNEVVALRVSNGLALAMLFAVGWRWAAIVNANRWKTGLALLALGVVLVVILIALGG